ncbi:interleukin 15, like isoform X1 [Takifugu rubripes]|uniref:interleukin 15, like isoform X1 n=1 Tax=Takifugu rubripes TaxID=31033 RepID=UPI0005D143F3|nr:interleukin 15-like isoform X1 [Takifugu rubripes]|eukprot:XP_011615936.1 PREDICTED: interleukin 15-like isoform X2 [Takifugu rubripes]
MLNLDAARVWDHVLSSGDTLASRVRWRGGRMLCVIFLLTVALQLAAQKACSYDIIISVQTLINSTSSLKCPESTLMCFAEEVKVLKYESEIEAFSLIRKLRRIAGSFKKPDCLQCELSAERATKQFLRDLLTVLQHMNALNC